jgi:hypothetical protein
MNNTKLSFSDELALSIDKYINPESHSKAHIYGWLAGVIVCGIFLILIYLNIIHLSGKYSQFIFLAPFPIAYFFVSANYFRWTNDRVAERQRENKDAKYCFCDLGNLPPYPEFGWKEARYTEFYTCILYVFISCFLMGCCLAIVLSLVLFMLIN